MARRSWLVLPLAVVTAALAAGLVSSLPPAPEPAPADEPVPRRTVQPAADQPVIELAFAGDVHFAGEFADWPDRDDATLGPMSAALQRADLAMVNLESAVTRRADRARKELERPADRHWFRAPPAALDVLERSGADVVSVANNHGADFGLAGLRDTIRAGEAAGVAVVGAGRNDREAFAPHRTRIRGVDVAVHAADASPRESADRAWAATPGSGPGLAAARGNRTQRLESAVRESARTDDLVVVYLHWGREGDACPTPAQQALAARLDAAGADVIVGSHAHTLLGSGRRGGAYVSYGLGNFFWYHGREAATGVLRLTVQGGQVIGDEWLPARIPAAGGAPRPLTGERARAAVERWHTLRDCTDLTPGPGPVDRPDAADASEDLPAFASSVRTLSRSVRAGMHSHDPAVCPVALIDLRHIVVTHVGFDGRAHRGELVAHAEVAQDVVSVFAELYAARFPIRRMLLIDEYDGDDDRSMAANNTSAYNCRRVAGQTYWSDHAFGRAIDINPVQNPYLVSGDVRPPAARRFVDVDRSAGARARPGVIVADGVVRRAFERIGWQWGGEYADPDFQHFSAPS